MIVGLDVGGTTIDAVAVADDDVRRPLAVHRAATPTGDAGALVAALARAVVEVRVAADGAADPVRAVGVAVPGVVDPAVGTVSHAVNLGITDPLPLAAALGEALGIPVAVDNDARAAALAALDWVRRTHAAGDDVVPPADGVSPADVVPPADVVHLNIGTGLSAGIVLGGRPHRGPMGHAGEIGHVPFPGGDHPCACGLTGCLEARIAGPAIARRWPEGGDAPARSLFTAAAEGRPDAVALADDVTADVARLVHLVVNMTGVGDVVLGGGVALAHPGLLDGVRRHLAATAARSPLVAAAVDPARVVTAPADGALGAAGAAALAAAHLADAAAATDAAAAAAPPPADADPAPAADVRPSAGTRPTPSPHPPTHVEHDVPSPDDAAAAEAGAQRGAPR